MKIIINIDKKKTHSRKREIQRKVSKKKRQVRESYRMDREKWRSKMRFRDK